MSTYIGELAKEFPRLFRVMTPEEEAEQREQERQREDVERRKREEATRRRWAAYGIPSKDIPAISASSLQDTDALLALAEFEREEQVLLVLSGPVGCGKTTAAARWLVNATAPRSYAETTARRFLPVGECARLSRYHGDSMAPIEKALALVLDDLGAEYLDDKGAFTSLLDTIIDARYRHMLPTVITTNLQARDFKVRYGERTVDRIREAGQFVEINGPSLRRRAT